ncbi:MAG: nucleotidyltransferase family protein [Candidatus Zhuqueibacterota bacterium]
MDREKIIQTLKKFKEENKDKYHIKSLGLFGSVAKNCMRDNSDIDVVVKLTKQDLFDLIGIKQDLEALLKYPIDVVSYREKMNAFLKKRIDEEAVYV